MGCFVPYSALLHREINFCVLDPEEESEWNPVMKYASYKNIIRRI